MALRAFFFALALSAGLCAAASDAAAQRGVSMDEACRPGTAVLILWNGRWYPGTVRGYTRKDGHCPIRYDGFGDEWDEGVPAERLRVR